MSNQATGARLLGTIIHGFERRVNQFMRYCEAHPEASEAELEERAREIGHDCFADVLQAAIEMKREAAEEAPRCTCGRPMAYKGDQVRRLETCVGRIELRRGYYYCWVCHKGRYPLDEVMGIGPSQFSDAIQSGVSRLAAALPFEAAADTYRAITGISIAGREVERLSEERGATLEAARAAERAELRFGHEEQGDLARGRRAARRERQEGIWAVALDAAKGRFNDGWHDVKAGVVFRAKSRVGEDGMTRVQAEGQSYIVEVGSLEEAGWKLYAEATRRGIDPGQDLVVCLGDGALGNWSQFAIHFSKRVEVLDWWHAVDHLWAASKGLFGEGTDRAKEWAEARKVELWEGKVDAVIAALRSEAGKPGGKAAGAEIHYFETNQERMRYDEYRAKGYPIGSGTVESACKRLIAARVRQSGMCWTKRGAQAILGLRAELLSDRWDEAWQAARPRLNAA